jgi:prepilin-type N-terminal cleavage/methylation domain-containing protein
MLMSSARHRKRSPLEARAAALRSGFTLIELILALTLLVIVLTTSYRLVIDCIETERYVDKISLPEKVGEGIISLIRRDLSGTFYRNMGRRTFLVADSGIPPEARDEIRFLSTVEPTPIEDPTGVSDHGFTTLRNITGVGYFLRPSAARGDLDAFTLFRKEITEFDPIEPLEGAGVNYEIYNKVRYLSVECFDGWSWYPDWDSQLRIEAEAEELLAMTEEGGVPSVEAPRASEEVLAAAPGVDPNAATEGTELLPPAAVPVAVRVEIGIYVMNGDRVERDARGDPVVKTFATVVEIPTAQRIPIDLSEETEDGAPGEDPEGEEGPKGEEGPRRLGGVGGGGPGGVPPEVEGILGDALRGRGGPGRRPPGAGGGGGGGGRGNARADVFRRAPPGGGPGGPAPGRAPSGGGGGARGGRGGARR